MLVPDMQCWLLPYTPNTLSTTRLHRHHVILWLLQLLLNDVLCTKTLQTSMHALCIHTKQEIDSIAAALAPNNTYHMNLGQPCLQTSRKRFKLPSVHGASP